MHPFRPQLPSGRPLEAAIKIIQEETQDGAFDPRIVAALVMLAETENGKARLAPFRAKAVSLIPPRLFSTFTSATAPNAGPAKDAAKHSFRPVSPQGKALTCCPCGRSLGDFSDIKKGRRFAFDLAASRRSRTSGADSQASNEGTTWCGAQLKADFSEIPDEIATW